MKCFVALLLLSIAVTSWGKYITTSLDPVYGYGYGLASTVYVKPVYTTTKTQTNAWKPIYRYKQPYTGHGSAYAYGYRPYYAASKPYHTYRPYYGYKPYYGYGSNYVYGNPYYHGSYDQGLYGYGHGYDYIDW